MYGKVRLERLSVNLPLAAAMHIGHIFAKVSYSKATFNDLFQLEIPCAIALHVILSLQARACK